MTDRDSRILHGDSLDVLGRLPPSSFGLALTSPPYADQRKRQYGGIPEGDYPDWSVRWAKLVRDLLTPTGSLVIVIRPHVKNGVLSDYVLKTRLALRTVLDEVDELAWIKPNAPPLGHNKRPRRSWEHILWFARDGRRVYCDPKANGHQSNRIGCEVKKGVGDVIRGVSKARAGVARCRDYVEVGTSRNDRSKFNTHPAQYPEDLAAWLIRLLCPPGGKVLDPFAGSGTTVVAAARMGVEAVGVEKDKGYCSIAERRLAEI